MSRKLVLTRLNSLLGLLKSKNATFQANLTILEERVTTLESNMNNSSSKQNTNRKNVYITLSYMDLPKSSELLPMTRISDNIKLINEIIQPISISLPPIQVIQDGLC